MNKPQSGASLLLIVLLLALGISVVLITYLVILTRTTRSSYNYLRSEISFYQGLGSLKEGILRYQSSRLTATPWPPILPNSENLTAGNTQITRTISQEDRNGDGVKDTIFTINASTNNIPKVIEAIFIPPTVVNHPADVIIIIDTSDSMKELTNPSDPHSSKFALAKIAANNFINRFVGQTNTQLAITTFDTGVNQIPQTPPADYFWPITTNEERDTIQTQINNLALGQSTNIGGALEKTNSSSYLGDPTTPKYILFLTDGIPTVRKTAPDTYQACASISKDDPAAQTACMNDAKTYALDEANNLKTNLNFDLKIFTIGLGDINNPKELNKELLSNLATQKDFFYTTPNAQDLDNIFQSIAQQIITQGQLDYQEIIP